MLASIGHVADTGRVTYPIGGELCDIRADHYNYSTSCLMHLFQWGPGWHNLEALDAVAFASPLFPLLCTVYGATFKAMTQDQVVKMQFSKDKQVCL